MAKIDSLIYHDIYNVILSKSKNLEEQRKKTKSPFLGLVRFFKNDKLIIDEFAKDGWHTNLTVASGREYAAQSAFKFAHASSTLGDISTYKIDHFGIGSGGSTITGGNIVTLQGPTLGDKGLYSALAINSSAISAPNNAGTAVADTAKKITSTGSGNLAGTITFEQSQNTSFTSLPDIFYTVVKCVCVIDNTEPSFLLAGQNTKVDEAMLFSTSVSDLDPKPFAHIAFAPKFVEKESVFKIEWFIIF